MNNLGFLNLLWIMMALLSGIWLEGDVKVIAVLICAFANTVLWSAGLICNHLTELNK